MVINPRALLLIKISYAKLPSHRGESSNKPNLLKDLDKLLILSGPTALFFYYLSLGLKCRLYINLRLL